MSKSNQAVISLAPELNNRLKTGFIGANMELDADMIK